MMENLKSDEINKEMKLQNKFVKKNLDISKIYNLVEINYLRLTTLFIFSNKSSALILVYLFNWLQSL